MASGYFVWSCRLGVIGILGAAAKYKYTYERIPTSPERTVAALSTFSKDTRRDFYDVAVVGGGIVGVATAREIRKQFPSKRVILLEKEADVAQHQSSHNSGVVHAGMYYPQNSFMARLCPRGHDLVMEYCKKNNLPCERIGKLVVATKEAEIPVVELLYRQGVDNGVRDLQVLRSDEEIKKIEPNVQGVAALYSPDTAITDYSAVARHMLKELQNSARGFFNAQFRFEAMDFVGLSVRNPTENVPEEMVLIRGLEEGQLGPEKVIVSKHVITCCGLSNDVIARRSGTVLSRVGNRVLQTFSFRGRYYQLKPEARGMVTMNVYPAPDNSKGVMLGVHFTPTVDERRGHQMIMGPSASIATHRYGYSSFFLDPEYCFNSLFSLGGFVNLLINFVTVARITWIDSNRSAFIREARLLVPSLKDSDVEECFCGVMGLAVGENGKHESDLSMELVRPRTMIKTTVKPGCVLEAVKDDTSGKRATDDVKTPLILNVRNAPSPAATSSMAIAEEIVLHAKKNFKW